MDTVRPILWDGQTVRRGELGELDRFRVTKSIQAVQPLLAAADEKLTRQRRTEHERRVALALQQPQGLGFLFPGLRPKNQR